MYVIKICRAEICRCFGLKPEVLNLENESGCGIRDKLVWEP